MFMDTTKTKQPERGMFILLPKSRIGRVVWIQDDGTAEVISGDDTGSISPEGTLSFRGVNYPKYFISTL